MAWEIVKELNVSGTKYTWNFPSALETAILNKVNDNGNPYTFGEISDSSSLHDYSPVSSFPFVNHYGSDGSWQSGGPYTIGSATMTSDAQYYNGEYVDLSNSQRVSASYITNDNGTIVYFFMVDEANQQGAFVSISSAWRLPLDVNHIGFYGQGTRTELYSQVYSDIVSAIPTQYNWVSVPSVSGKNGILSLATIKDEYINSGESVTGASLSNFDAPPNISNVLPLINDVMPDDDTDPTSVRVTFGIPTLAVGTYSQIKLLTKKDGIPRSVDDADIVTNLDEPTSVTRIGHTVVGNLAELTEYYFTIHVEDEIGTFADSEPVGPVRTGKHEGIIKMQVMITGGISENGFAEAVSYEKVTT